MLLSVVSEMLTKPQKTRFSLAMTNARDLGAADSAITVSEAASDTEVLAASAEDTTASLVADSAATAASTDAAR